MSGKEQHPWARMDDLIELDNFTVTLSEDEQWANYLFPCYRGRKHRAGWHRGQRRFAESKSGVLLVIVNRILKAEGIVP